MNWKAFGLAGVALSLLAAPAVAHHSFAMFDHDKMLTLTGTVKEFEWTNPHSWLRVVVQDPNGKALEWSLEMASIGANQRIGWKADTVKPGDKVTVNLRPLKDGSRGGQFLTVVLPNGQKLGDGGRPNNATGD